MSFSSSWDHASEWYHSIASQKGHYYHRQVIFPSLLRALPPTPSLLLDLACGPAAFASFLPKRWKYYGVDSSAELIRMAREDHPRSSFFCHDVTRPFDLPFREVEWITTILALQNVEFQQGLIQQAAHFLSPGGSFIMVLNHPCFRIPQSSDWQFDRKERVQYHRLDRYLSPHRVEIRTHPGRREDHSTTHSYHFSLSTLSDWIGKAGLIITEIKELCSDKKSEGGRAKEENRARKEDPLFLQVTCKKGNREDSTKPKSG
ncbi:MAG: methyltransferase domain-containing protein [Chlamydiota bacterium]|nr:methyltransferase domain-containing protein [Chlamydiota bacterium]